MSAATIRSRGPKPAFEALSRSCDKKALIRSIAIIRPPDAAASARVWAPAPQPTSRMSGAEGRSPHMANAFRVHSVLPGPR
jgi:hypothetical protein